MTYEEAIRDTGIEHAKEIIIHTAMAMNKALRPRSGAKHINDMLFEVAVQQQQIVQGVIDSLEQS